MKAITRSPFNYLLGVRSTPSQNPIGSNQPMMGKPYGNGDRLGIHSICPIKLTNANDVIRRSAKKKSAISDPIITGATNWLFSWRIDKVDFWRRVFVFFVLGNDRSECAIFTVCYGMILTTSSHRMLQYRRLSVVIRLFKVNVPRRVHGNECFVEEIC